MEQQLAAQLLKAAQLVEEQLDGQIAKLDAEKNGDDAEFEEIRRKRMQELRKVQERRQELAFLGHGRLMELSSEQEFFTTCKDSNKVVCHFYDVTSRMSPVVNNALEKLATKHFGARFVKVNAEKVPFLIKRLNIRKPPTIGIAIDSKMIDFIRVISEFGDKPDNGINMDQLEKRLSASGVIDYNEPPKAAKNAKQRTIIKNLPKKTIRTRESSGSDDSADW